MLSLGWALGIFFFIFIFAAIGFITVTNPKRPQRAPATGPEVVAMPVDRTAHGTYHICRDYRLEIPPQAFVNYPFGLRVVFPNGAAEPQASNASRGFQEQDYIGWDQPDQDPHLLVQHGRIEFECDEPEPVVRADLRFAPEAFQAEQSTVTGVLQPGRQSVLAFWLNPSREQTAALVVSLSHVMQNGARRELVDVPIPLVVESFPIRLR